MRTRRGTAPATSPRALTVVALLTLLTVAIFVGVRVARSEAVAAPSAPEAEPKAVATAGASEAPAVVHAGISGHVRDASGGVVGGAIVCASATACATASDDGSYELRDLPPETALSLVASAAGRAPGPPVRARLAVGERRDGVDLVVQGDGVATRGRVRDALGGVVAGATVVLSLGDSRGAIAVASDAHGDFVAWVGRGWATVSATAAGYAVASAYGYAPDRFFDLSLVPGAVVAGRVIERSTGAAVAGVKIDAVGLDGGRRRTTTSGDDGSFRVDGLSPGRYMLEGLAPELSGYSRSAVLVGVGETSTEIVVELERSPAVSARVLEARTGAPCTAGKVLLRDKRNDEYAHAAIEPDGAVRFVAVLPGNYDVEIACEDHANPRAVAPVIVRDHAIDGLVWEVERGVRVSGLVVDVDGKPVTNAEVHAMPDNPEEAGSGSAMTDAHGQFTLRGLGATKYTFAATAPSAGTDGRLELDLGQRDQDGVRLALGRGASVDGKVTDVDGAPMAGVTVVLSGPSTRRVETGPDGAFAVSGLAAGDYRLGARSDDAPRRGRRITYGRSVGKATADARVTVALGETARANLVLERRAEIIEGTVVDARGAPLADYFVEAQRIDGVRASASRYDALASGAITDSLGHFRVERLGAGDYAVRAFRPGGAEGSVARVAAGAKSVAIKISAGAISGTVTASRGVRPDRFHVTVSGPSHRAETVFHANGAFVLRDLAPGDYEVTVRAAEGTASTKVSVTDEGTASITLALEATDATD